MNNGSQIEETVITSYRLQRIDGQALDSHWQYIRDKLLVIEKKVLLAFKKRGLTGPPQSIPEQIRLAILRGLAGQNTVEAYFVLDQDGRIRGFFTTTSPWDEFLGVQLVLYVWHAWGEPGGVMEVVQGEVEKIARSRGMLAIEHTSPRLEWMHRHRRDGFKLSVITWRKEL